MIRRRCITLRRVILFSISYGWLHCRCCHAIGWRAQCHHDFLLGKTSSSIHSNPETQRYLVSYIDWAKYAFPMFIARLPIVAALLIFTFKPETTDMSRAVSRLRAQVSMMGADAQWPNT